MNVVVKRAFAFGGNGSKKEEKKIKRQERGGNKPRKSCNGRLRNADQSHDQLTANQCNVR